MIGNPVSMPRVIRLVEEYHRRAGAGSVAVVHVSEQEIMDSMLLANRHGHIACTQGGESLAGLRVALAEGLLEKDETAVLDATAHHLKFIGFQQMYFEDSFPPEFEVTPKAAYQNRPQLLTPKSRQAGGEDPGPGRADRRLAGVDPERLRGCLTVAGILSFLQTRDNPQKEEKMQKTKLWAHGDGGKSDVGVLLVLCLCPGSAAG